MKTKKKTWEEQFEYMKKHTESENKKQIKEFIEKNKELLEKRKLLKKNVDRH